MSFLQKSNNFGSHRKEKRTSLASIFLVLFFIGIFSLPISRNFLFTVFSPLWSTENSFTSFFTANSELLKSKTALIEENNALKQQIAESKQGAMLNEIIRKQNEDFKNILNRKSAYQQQTLAAVLVKPFLSPYDTLIIDIGSGNGVSVGDKVLANGNTYIGLVSNVYTDSSKVTLYSSPGQKTQVLIGNDNIEKEAVGLGGGNFSVEMPRETNIAEGDSIIVPSISSNIFATVGKINFREADSFQTVLFKSPTNIDELKWVEVLSAVKK